MGNLCSSDIAHVADPKDKENIVKDDVDVKPAGEGENASVPIEKDSAGETAENETDEAVKTGTTSDAVEEEHTSDVLLWAMPISANSATIRCFLKACDVEFLEKNAYGVTRTSAYITKFPTNLSPAIEHDGKYVTECSAILRYLARAYPKEASRFYDEKDLESVTKIDWLLEHANTGILAQLPKAVYPTLGFPLYPGDCAMLESTKEHTPEAMKEAAQYIKKAIDEKYCGIFLKETTFLMSNTATIADFRFAPMINFIKVAFKIPVRLQKYYDEMELIRGFKDGCAPLVEYTSPKWAAK